MSFFLHHTVVRVFLVFAIVDGTDGCQPSKPEPRQTRRHSGW